MSIVNPETDKYLRNIEVQFEGQNYLKYEGLSIVESEKPKITVIASGSKSDLSSVKSNNINAVVNLNDLKEGENKVPINVSVNGVTGRIVVKEVEPSQLIVTLEKITSENIKVNIETLGNLPEGYVLGDISSSNGFVRITEAQSKINQIKKAICYVDINDKTESFVASTKIEFLDKNGLIIDGIESDKSKINVDVPIFRVKSVPISLNFVGELKDGQKIENVKLSEDMVMIKGSSSVIDKIESIQTESIDYETLQGSSEIPIKLQLPDGASIYKGLTDIKLSYNFINNIEKTIEFDLNNLVIKNENPEFEYSIENASDPASIKIYGDSEMLELIDLDSMVFFVDAKDLSEGRYTLDINFENDNNLNIREIIPAKADIIIKEKESE